MHITILFASPNRHGSTSILADNFISGATEAGHECEIVDVAHMNIAPCTGCIACGYGCGSPSMTKSSKYPQVAYRLGKRL